MKKDYLRTDTIVALATSLGGPLAIVRMSGSLSLGIIQKLSRKSSWKHSKSTRTNLFNSQGVLLDEAMVVYFEDPKSFTGEASAELYLHGSSQVVDSCLNELCVLGAKLALPGEFSFRAVKNGKMTIDQARAISDLISSQNQMAASLALDKMQGLQGKRIQEITEELKTLATLGELGIDFSDQDLEEVSLKSLSSRVNKVISELEILKESFDRGSKVQEGIKAAFVGLPNAGKSSLFNALLGEERSIVTELAGTTRDVIRETLTLRAVDQEITFKLFDTAGLRKSDELVESIGVERSLKSFEEAEVLFWIVDSQKINEDSQALLEIKERILKFNKQASTLLVFNKMDLTTIKDQYNHPLFKEFNKVYVSAKSQEGIQEFIKVAIQLASQQVYRLPGEILLTKKEEVEAIESATPHLRQATNAKAEELFVLDLRHALEALSPLIGETPNDELLGRLFGQFCIGK